MRRSRTHFRAKELGPQVSFPTLEEIADRCHENKTDSRSDSKADILVSTLLDNHGQQRLFPGATSATRHSQKDQKEPPKEFDSPSSSP